MRDFNKCRYTTSWSFPTAGLLNNTNIFPDNKDYSNDEDEDNDKDMLRRTYDRHDIYLNLNFVCYIDTIQFI